MWRDVIRLAAAGYRELMSGHDGRLSFTKHIIVVVLALFATSHALPVWFTFTILLSSKSVVLLYAWLLKLPSIPVLPPPSGSPGSSSTSASPEGRIMVQP